MSSVLRFVERFVGNSGRSGNVKGGDNEGETGAIVMEMNKIRRRST